MLFNGWLKLRIIDNTDDGAYIKGWSELDSITSPNRGKVLESKKYNFDDEIYFYEFGIVSGPDGKFIHEDNIILANGKLVLPGILCGRVTLTHEVDGFIMHDAMDHLIVLYSNIPECSRGDIVMIQGKSAHWINYYINQEYKRIRFVQPQSIMMILSAQDPEERLRPGRDYEIITPRHLVSDGGEQTVVKGADLHFNHNGKEKSLVKKKNVVAKV